ncbi:MAG: Ig-like domain-containing protein [Gemmatimonadaceae bacterium]
MTAASTALTVGGSTQLTAVPVGADGTVIQGARVIWSSVTPGILAVSGSGVATAVAAGVGTARAAVGARTADVVIVVRNPPAATVAFDKDSAVLTLPNGSLTLVPVVKDTAGKPIPNPTLFYTVDAPRVASVNQLGVVTAVAAGTAVVTGSTDDKSGSIRIRVTANATTTSPRITGVTPMMAGGNAVITGTNFAPTVGGNAVLVEGIPATVTSATTTQLGITLPAGGWSCEPTRLAAIQVNANNEIGVATASLRVANQRSLAVGQSVVVTNPSEVRCNELPVASGTYLVTVYNAARTLSGNNAAFILRGLPATSALTAAVSTAVQARPAARAPRAAVPRMPVIGSSQFARWQRAGDALRDAERESNAHLSIMQRSMDFARAAGSPIAASRRLRAANEPTAATRSARAHQVAQLGNITPVKIPNLDAQNFCTSSIPIGVRTAWVGQHAVIVEDTTTVLNGAPTLKGQLDSLYARIGTEFDTVMWPILTTDFGNPLAMDGNLKNGIGKIVMLFSPRINTMAGGAVAGFVVSCDFFPPSQAPSSNEAEFFYAIMPTSGAAGISVGTRDAWMRSIRSTIIHEAKHITAFGERFNRNLDFEELWLEEGTARHAEELFARSIYGVPWKGNTGYANSVYCDVRPASASAPQCAGRPVLMLRHFDALYQYLQGPEQYSVVGRVAPGDATFYATAWSIVRWAIDHYATSEASFLSAMVQGAPVGVASLEARTGTSWEEMFGAWALTLYADDYPGVTFADPRLGFPTWNLRDEFRGMCIDFGPCQNSANVQNVYPLEFPLTPRPLAFGTFADTVNFLNAATFTMRSLNGTQTVPQLLEVRGIGVGDPPPQLRIAILRVQ